MSEKDSLAITLTGVEDSRCPANANCVWPGIAVAFLEVYEGGGEPEVKYLSNLGVMSNDFKPDTLSIKFEDAPLVVGEYAIRVTDVMPIPKDTTEIAQNKYEITFEASQN